MHYKKPRSSPLQVAVIPVQLPALLNTALRQQTSHPVSHKPSYSGVWDCTFIRYIMDARLCMTAIHEYYKTQMSHQCAVEAFSKARFLVKTSGQVSDAITRSKEVITEPRLML